MTAGLLPPGVLQFLDSNGDPLVGGTVTYEDPASPGVLKTIWNAPGQTTPVDNPTTLSLFGIPTTGGSECAIWGVGSYLMFVRDRNGVLQWSALTEQGLDTSGGTINGNLTITGLLTGLNEILNGTLNVAGTATLQNVVILSGTGSFSDVFISHSLALNGDQIVSGDMTIDHALHVGADADIFGTLSVGGPVTFGSTLNVVGTVQTGGDLGVTGQLGVTQSILSNTDITALVGMFAPAFNVTSDRRLKTIHSRSAARLLDAVQAIPLYFGHYNARPGQSLPMVVADEVQKTLPWAVNGEPNAVGENGEPILQSVNLWNMVISLLGAVQELAGRVASLESGLAAVTAGGAPVDDSG